MIRTPVAALTWLALVGLLPHKALLAEPLRKIAFGSCANQNRPQPVWDRILEKNPDLFLFLGDNVYADSTDPAEIRAAYNKLGAVPGFRKLRTSCGLLATWDDHDYGINDGGHEHPRKAESQAAFQDFFGIPEGSALRERQGVYSAHLIGPAGRSVQVILLDTRFHRGPLAKIKIAGRPFYVPDGDPTLTMLGERQWRWLERELRKPAELRLIASSIQVLPTDHPFEKWNNLPRERQRLLEMVRRCAGGAVLFLSGDQHFGEVTVIRHQGFEFREFTSSGLTHHRGSIAAPNSDRVGRPLIAINFGLIEIDWSAGFVKVSICDSAGVPQITQQHDFAALTPGNVPR